MRAGMPLRTCGLWKLLEERHPAPHFHVMSIKCVSCDGGINAMVEGSKFKESHVLENTKLWNKVGRMPRPLVLFRPSNSGLASFCACFRYPVLGRSCPYASRHISVPPHFCPDKSGRQVSLYSMSSNLEAIFELDRSSIPWPRISGTGR